MRRTSMVMCAAGILVAASLACRDGGSGYPMEPNGQFPPLASSFDKSAWSAPIPLEAPVNDPTANEQGPALSADGLSLYFCSNRAPSLGNDLWVSRRSSDDAPWGAPMNLGTTVNSREGDCGPSLSDDGLLLLFTSGRPGIGANDIYMSRRTDPNDDMGWGPPIRLGPEVNTVATEFSPFITRFRGGDCEEDGCAVTWADLYFERSSSTSGFDIYVVRLGVDGVALGPAVAVDDINSDANDGRPTVRFDGREMILHSARDGRLGNADLFVSTRQSSNHPWTTPEPILEVSVAGRHEIHPYLSRDGRTLFFVRGTGVANDIWMATRTPSGH